MRVAGSWDRFQSSFVMRKFSYARSKASITINTNFELSSSEGKLLIRYVPPVNLTIGSGRRAAHAVRLVRSVLKRLPNCRLEVANNTISVDVLNVSAPYVSETLRLANEKLDLFSREKLTAKDVEKLLGITALERQRWTKDGRLPHSGTVSFKRGKTVVQLATYLRETIFAFWSQPELIKRWREIDTAKHAT